MKITAIEFSTNELDQIYNSLIERFDLEKGDIYTKGQIVEFNLTEEVQIESKIDLLIEGDIDENNQASIISQSVCNFRITVFYDGSEVRSNIYSSDIEYKIRNYYKI